MKHSIEKSCLICGQTVKVISPAPEIITCENDHCVRIVENSIGLHYATVSSVSHGQIPSR